MSVFQQVSDIVVINEEQFPLDLFLQLEPDYPVVDYRHYVHEKIHVVVDGGVQQAGPIVWKEGKRYLQRCSDLRYLKSQNMLDEQERKVKIETTKKDNLSYNEKRKNEYPSIEDLVVAMWEYLCMSNPKELKGLETKRKEIKNKFPKDD